MVALRPQSLGEDVGSAWQKPLDNRDRLDLPSTDGSFAPTQFSDKNLKNLVGYASDDDESPPQIPAWIPNVLSLAGRISIARIDPQKLPHLVEHLNKPTVRIDYFWPKQLVLRNYGRIKRKWYKSLISGTVFIAGDVSGWNAASDFAKHCGWGLTWLRPSSGAGQNVLRRDLDNLERKLLKDCTASPLVAIKAGSRCRVTSGPLQGVQGVVEGNLAGGILQIVITALGQCVPVEIAREMLEPVN